VSPPEGGWKSLSFRCETHNQQAEAESWAGKTLPTLQHYLEMAQDLDKKK
jgi:hypothetical protein